MHNLLPNFKSLWIEQSRGAVADSWNPSEANAETGRIPECLESIIAPPPPADDAVYSENRLPILPPNQRYVSPIILARLDDSELSAKLRGETEASRINYTHQNKSITPKTPKRLNAFSNFLVLQMTNVLPVKMDLFLQKNSAISNIVVQTCSTCCRTISGKGSVQDCTAGDVITLLYSTTRRNLVTLIEGRQEIREYVFKCGLQIGIEVRIEKFRIICVRVIPESQAAEYELELTGAEIVAVNGTRVLTIESFRNEVVASQSNFAQIHIQAVIYIGGKKKMDEFRSDEKNVEVKDVLSKIFQQGYVVSRDTNDERSCGDSDDVECDDEEDEEFGNEDLKKERKEEEGMQILNEELVSSRMTSMPLSLGREDDIASMTSSITFVEDITDTVAPLRTHHMGSLGVKDRLRQMKFDDDSTEVSGGVVIDGDYEDREYLDGDYTADEARGFDEDEEEKAMVANRTERSGTDIDNRLITTEVKGEKESKLTNLSSNSSADTIREPIQENWNYATSLNNAAQSVPHVVCLPPYLMRSEAWGAPTKNIQFSNFSSAWKIEIFWVDTYGALQSRAEVENGSTHFEQCSAEHLWVVTASPTKTYLQNTNKDRYSEFSGDRNVYKSNGDVEIGISPAMLAVKPCRATLQGSSCTSIIWSPWSSNTITKRINAQQKAPPPRAKPSGASTVIGGESVAGKSKDKSLPTIMTPPQIHVQILDSSVNFDHSNDDEFSQRVTKQHRTIQLPKWPKRRHKLVSLSTK